MADPKIHAPPTCYHVKFDSSATKSVRINRKEPQKVDIARASPSWAEAWLTPRKKPLCYHAEFGHSALNGIQENPQNWGALGLRPCAVVASVTP